MEERIIELWLKGHGRDTIALKLSTKEQRIKAVFVQTILDKYDLHRTPKESLDIRRKNGLFKVSV